MGVPPIPKKKFLVDSDNNRRDECASVKPYLSMILRASRPILQRRALSWNPIYWFYTPKPNQVTIAIIMNDHITCDYDQEISPTKR